MASAPQPAEQPVGFFHQLTYAAANSALALGYTKVMEFTDLPPLDAKAQAARQVSLLEAHWAARQEGAGQSLTAALVAAYATRFSQSVALELLELLLGFVGPVAMKSTIVASSSAEKSSYEGLLMSFLLFAASIARGCSAAWSLHVTTSVGMDVHSALVGALYRKTFTTAGGGAMSRGDVLNTQSNDSLRAANVVSALNVVWTAPLTVLVSTVLLIQQIGAASLAGVAFLLLIVPLQGAAVASLEALRSEGIQHTDLRLSLLSEAVNGIKNVKLSSMEGHYKMRIHEVRTQELRCLRMQSYWHAISSCLTFVAPTLTSVVTFMVHALLGNKLDAPALFTSLSLFNLLRLPLSFMPVVLFSAVEASVSIDRISEVLSYPDLADPLREELGGPAEAAMLRIVGARFTWARHSGVAPSVLVDDVTVPQGSLCLVIGKVGSGKTSLLHALLGSMELVAGHCRVDVPASSQIAYCSQSPWMQNASIQENILFGQPLFRAHYERVIRCAMIEADLRQMPLGDQTEIGEKGASLSGGQKQRISLARSAYSGASLLLLDDALSALDASVAAAVFQNCILNPDVMGLRTRLLATHQVGFLPFADQVIVMDDGCVAFSGTFAMFAANENMSALASVLKDHGAPSSEQAAGGPSSAAPATAEAPGGAPAQADDGEERATGALSSEIVLRYLECCGSSVYFFAGFVALAEVCQATSDLWLSMLSELSQGASSTTHLLLVYCLLGALIALLSFFRGVAVVEAAVHASSRLHASMLDSLCKASLSRFFDATPAGRALSRFGKDVDALDTSLADTVNAFSSTLVLVLGTVGLLVALMPALLIIVTPISLAYAALLGYYRSTSRELARLSATQSSPVYAHLSESLWGVTTIKAFRREGDFCKYNAELLDDYHACYWLSLLLGRWLNVRLELMGALVVLGAGLSAVLQQSSMQAGEVGLCLTYSLQIVGALEMVVSGVSNLEQQLNAVERALQYAHHIPTESAYLLPQRPSWNWLAVGSDLHVCNLSARYRDNLPNVLESVSCTIQSGERVGVVGRTGSGKSSLFLALFRVLEPSHGSIVLGGVNTSRVGLRDLRSQLVIIPQDPILSSGTTRSNLDPYGEHADRDILAALRVVRFINPGQEEVLGTAVAEEGSNFSVGQRQLICLARAVLKRCRVLLMDEATANVDFATDQVIQQTVRNHFREATLIAIAHRLDTIITYDKIVVLQSGSLAEMGTPHELLRRERGILADMVHHSAKDTLLNA